MKQKTPQKGYAFVEHKGTYIGILYKTKVGVLEKNNTRLTIKTGGWQTRSTMKAINTFLRQSPLDATASMRAGDIFLHYKERKLKIKDGVAVDLASLFLTRESGERREVRAVNSILEAVV